MHQSGTGKNLDPNGYMTVGLCDDRGWTRSERLRVPFPIHSVNTRTNPVGHSRHFEGKGFETSTFMRYSLDRESASPTDIQDAVTTPSAPGYLA